MTAYLLLAEKLPQYPFQPPNTTPIGRTLVTPSWPDQQKKEVSESPGLDQAALNNGSMRIQDY